MGTAVVAAAVLVEVEEVGDGGGVDGVDGVVVEC